MPTRALHFALMIVAFHAAALLAGQSPRHREWANSFSKSLPAGPTARACAAETTPFSSALVSRPLAIPLSAPGHALTWQPTGSVSLPFHAFEINLASSRSGRVTQAKHDLAVRHLKNRVSSIPVHVQKAIAAPGYVIWQIRQPDSVPRRASAFLFPGRWGIGLQRKSNQS